MESRLTPNALSVLALANEYCQAVELAPSTGRMEFTATVVRLLPRIYIAVSDLPAPDDYADSYGADRLDENTYDEVRAAMATLLGEEDSYLEVFESDMQYSDTPIGASLAEGLADIYQPLYNLVAEARDAGAEAVPVLLDDLRRSFSEYWSQTLCNVMRPLNHLLQTAPNDQDA